MTAPRRALDTPVLQRSESPSGDRPRRVAVTFSSICLQTADGVADAFRRRPAGSRRSITPWYHWAVRVGTIAGVGVSAAAVAAFTIPSSAPIQQPISLPTTAPVVRTVMAGMLSNPDSGKLAEGLVSQSRMFSTGSLAIRAKAKEKSEQLGTLVFGQQVMATAEVSGDYRLIEVDGVAGWVLADKLVRENEELEGGISMAPCSRGSKIEAKLRSDTIKIYRSVCALFPGVNSYGGWRAGGRQFHKNGRALDIMLTPKKESKMGWQIAKYLTSHYREFNIDHVIFEQKIWTPSNQRWRKMADRGSLNANHYNHVHVAIKA